MPDDRDVQVHLLPQWVPEGRLAGGLAVVADSYNGGRLCYHDAGPRECVLPRGQPGENALSFSSGACQNGKRTVIRQSMLPALDQTAKETV